VRSDCFRYTCSALARHEARTIIVAASLKTGPLPDERQVAILSSIARIPNFCLSSIAILRDTNGCLEFIPASDKMPDIVFGVV
jgi:hypothetical protein